MHPLDKGSRPRAATSPTPTHSGSEGAAVDDARLREAREVMLRFADATGLSSDRPARRYLWTDAFAVCNFVGLCRATGEARYGSSPSA